MKKLLILAALAAIAAGCSATKINFEKNADGTSRYSIWHNDHWLKTEAESLTGGMSQEGQFSLGMTGLKSSPSEEFNKMIQAYTSAVVSMTQIAAAAYNPYASAAARGTSAAAAPSPSAGAAPAPSTSGAAAQAPSTTECADGSCSDGACTDGSCPPEAK